MPAYRGISVEQLRCLLEYNPQTGVLRWLPRPVSMFDAEWRARAWNTRFAGKEAFTASNSKGYRIGVLLELPCTAHVVAWALYYGEWPKEQVDHWNLDKSDNRAVNLREAAQSQNVQNRPTPYGSSRHKGVGWHKSSQRWRARVQKDGKRVFCGYFHSESAAVAARDACAASLFGSYAFLNTGA